MKKKAVVVLANGFEEVEAVTPIDILKRAGVDVFIAGIGGTQIVGSRGVTINTDTRLSDIDFVPDAVVFPGGMPGAEHLASSTAVKDIIRAAEGKGKIIAAICASPALVLAPMGILDGKNATCYPGMEENFSSAVKFSGDDVVQDGNIITSRGVGTALAFALKVAENLVGAQTAKMVAKAVLYQD